MPQNEQNICKNIFLRMKIYKSYNFRNMYEKSILVYPQSAKHIQSKGHQGTNKAKGVLVP